MKTIGITGFTGRVGRHLIARNRMNYVLLECDVSNTKDVRKCMEKHKPDLVLHLAAKSDVDWCEHPDNQKSLSRINLGGTYNILEASEDVGSSVVLLSSDHIFGGWRGSYKENHAPYPVNQYGRSKLAAESLAEVFDNFKIVRTSYLFDYHRLSYDIQNAIHDIAKSYPVFIKRSFLHLDHFCLQLETYLSSVDSMPKVLHLTGSQTISWYRFMQNVAVHFHKSKDIIIPRRFPLQSAAPRPLCAGLNSSLSRTLGIPQFSYLDGIKLL